MSLFFDVLSSINNPNQQGSIEQLGSVTNSLQQLANAQGMNSDQMTSVLSALGGALQPALKQQAGMMGSGQLDSIIGQLAGGGSGLASLQSMIPPQMQQQLIQSVAQKSGLNAGMVQSMLPQMLPAVMGLLGMGARKPGQGGGNMLLNSFLDTDRSGNADLGDVMKFANRFLNPPQ
jgi:hypothetical protein